MNSVLSLVCFLFPELGSLVLRKDAGVSCGRVSVWGVPCEKRAWLWLVCLAGRARQPPTSMTQHDAGPREAPLSQYRAQYRIFTCNIASINTLYPQVTSQNQNRLNPIELKPIGLSMEHVAPD